MTWVWSRGKLVDNNRSTSNAISYADDNLLTIAYLEGALTERAKLRIVKKYILAIIERRDDPAVKLREIKETLERVKE
jgi:hypothetical protein